MANRDSVAHMTRLHPASYLEHLQQESARFRQVLSSCDPQARVPSCPDWNAADLLWHLGTVQYWWSEVLLSRPGKPDNLDPPRPTSYDELLAAFDTWSAALVDALEGLDPAEPAWNWSADHTVGFILRRQAHEALIHRLDAELGAGVSSPIDTLLAADGVHEALEVMYGAYPPWGSWEPLPELARVDIVDTGHSVWLQFGLFSGTDPGSDSTYTDDEDFHVVAAPAGDVEPDVIIDGPAAALDLWLWHRANDSAISTAGNPEVLDRLRKILAQPLD